MVDGNCEAIGVISRRCEQRVVRVALEERAAERVDEHERDALGAAVRQRQDVAG